MSFVKSKSCCCSAGSFCFACVTWPGLLQKGLTKPGSGCLHDRSPDGCEGLERGLGWRRDMVGGGDGGRDLERKGKCGSTHSQSPVTCSSQLESALRSKPESYVTGYWSVRVHVGKPSASWGLKDLADVSAAIQSHGVPGLESRYVSVSPEVLFDPYKLTQWEWDFLVWRKVWGDIIIYAAGVTKQALALWRMRKWEPESGLSPLIATTCHYDVSTPSPPVAVMSSLPTATVLPECLQILASAVTLRVFGKSGGWIRVSKDNVFLFHQPG